MIEENKNEVPQESSASEEVVQNENQVNKPASKEPERQDMTTLHERAIATLSYFGPLAIVPFYLKKDSEFCRFHGKQGLLLAIIFFIAKLFTVIDLVMDISLILQVFIALWMGLAALSGRWKRMPSIYKWSCELEETLSLKTKEEEMEEVKLRPEELSSEKVQNS